MNNLRKIAAGSLAAVLAFSMAACGSSNASSDGTGESTGKAVTVNEKSAKATSLADFGTMEDLEKAAKEEGALNVIALPHDWSNYGEVIESFKKKYPEIKVTELNPNASSKEELDAAKTNKGTDAAPDVFDVGQAIAATSTDYFAPYKVQAWDKIPDTAKDADGATTPTTPASCPWAGTPTSTATSAPWTTCSTRSSPAPWPSTASPPRLAPPSTAT